MTPFFAYPAEVRRVLYTTNAIESLNMQLRKIIENRGRFPSDEAATKSPLPGAPEHHGRLAQAHAPVESSPRSVRNPIFRKTRRGSMSQSDEPTPHTDFWIGPIGVSQSTIWRIWRAFNLQPYRVESFRLANDPLFVEKARGIVGLYTNPPPRFERRRVVPSGLLHGRRTSGRVCARLDIHL